MLGRGFLIMLTILVLVISYAVVWRRSLLPRIFAILIIVVISYAIPSLSSLQSIWFGSAFDSILIIATVYLIAPLYEPIVAASSPPRSLAFISAGMPTVGIGLLLVCNLSGMPSTVFQMDPASREDLTDRTARI
jgi:hypothetical protein